MIPKTGIVLVDFWGTHCKPCMAMLPTLEKIAEKYDGKIKVVKIDVGANQKFADKCGVRAVPTLILFKDGEIVDGITGLTTQDKIESMIKRHTD